MKVIAISTNKGGCLKTSLTVNLAGAIKNKRILIIDTDNQGNCSISFGKNPDLYDISLYDVLIGFTDPRQAITNVYKNIDILPANDDMSFLEFDVLADRKNYPRPFKLLADAVEKIKSDYDLILIDTPPNLGLVQGNVLSFADAVLIPFQPEQYSMRSLIKIIKAINDFKQQHNPKLSILGIVATLVDFRTVLHAEVIQECRKYCDQNNIRMFDTVIPRTVRFASSIAYDRLPGTITNKNHPAVANYFELIGEMKINE